MVAYMKRIGIYISERVHIAGTERAKAEGLSFSAWLERAALREIGITDREVIERELADLKKREKALVSQLTVDGTVYDLKADLTGQVRNIYHARLQALKDRFQRPTLQEVINQTKARASELKEYVALSRIDRERLIQDVALEVYREAKTLG